MRFTARAFLTTTFVSLTLSSYLIVPTTQAADKVRWRVPVAFASDLPGLGDPITYVADSLMKASNGDIELRVSEPGKLVPPFEITDAVKNNKVPAGYTWIGYDQGKIPASPLFAAVPFGMEPWEYTAWWYEGGGRQLGEEVYGKQNIQPLLCSIIGPETAGWFRNEIKGLDDLKGLKIRFAGIGGRVIQQLGSSVTMLPGGEIFQALEKGAIDATEFSMPAIDQKLGFDKVVKYNYFPGWHQAFTASYLLVNKEEWGKLSEGQKAMIDMACTAAVARSTAKGEGIQGGVIKSLQEKGVTVSSLPEPILRELQKVTQQVMAEEAAKDADFKKVMESQKAFMETYKIWKALAYLPRNF
ncbi:TRAP-type mannitol/chloroaromatic compound transport system, periplasmic component [Beggiatoa alba B18LD]|uniref:TRAP-type mannitol/chloroaromatic compound transport system, periplasmic component n=1 Tax=Beggiatoa alba B18LD TaxID=395493 RepID=I3CEH1_9GAMM|nr:TRAP transporter substrate-binding protein [Beggiatoa alba]EIJ42014.1 TRAP-type mannitol/chloroaromatic compound transport system, periplasmic component [Beggiatoa alba B18LD]